MVQPDLAGRANVHGWSLPHRLDATQYLDAVCVVLLSFVIIPRLWLCHALSLTSDRFIRRAVGGSLILSSDARMPRPPLKCSLLPLTQKRRRRAPPPAS